MNSVKNRTECNNNGGQWENGKCSVEIPK
jgi:hypothetical protein